MSSIKRGRSLAEVMSPIDDDAAQAADLPSAPKAVSATTGVSEASGPAIVPVNVLVTPEDRRRLRQLSLDANLSLQKLGHEAWNLLLQKRGLPPLKPVSANVRRGRPNSSRPR